MSADLTVAQLNKIHARIHELIKNAEVHDETIESFGPTPEKFGNVWHTSEIKALLYKEYADILGYHQSDSRDYDYELGNNEFPRDDRQPQPETVAELIKILSENPFTLVTEDVGGVSAIAAVDSQDYKLKVREALWQKISAQVIEELPALLANKDTFVGRTGR